MDAVLNRLAGTARRRIGYGSAVEGVADTRRSHLRPLVDRPLSVPIGLVDCPYDQRRDVLIADLAGAAGNVAIVGAPQSGKSTALRTLVMAVAATHDPSAPVLLPGLRRRCVVVVAARTACGIGGGRSDADLCRRTVAEMESVMRREKPLPPPRYRLDDDYRRLRADGVAAAADDPFGDVFLVIDGWAILRQDFEPLEPRSSAIAAQGLSYGVHVVVTASRWAEIRPALKDQIGTASNYGSATPPTPRWTAGVPASCPTSRRDGVSRATGRRW
jgi:S-DNA-T family DNA segregation ATPase FtsK/SpoIIIE